MPLKQDSRMLGFSTPELPDDTLAIRSFSLQEHIGRMFQIEAELSSEQANIDFDKVVGHPATIRLNLLNKEKRYFNGIVSRMVQTGNVGAHAHYRATIVPWLWFLTRNSDCCAWVTAEDPEKGKSVPDIIEDVFKKRSFSAYEMNPKAANYPKREFCVQYRETDFQFVSRLMEQEGIYYFFRHENGKHTLVIADATSTSKPFPKYEELTFHDMEKGAVDREVVTEWTMEKEAQPVTVTLNDFDFTKPKTSLKTTSKVERKYGKAQYEVFEHPGMYLKHEDGQKLADIRLAEIQTQYESLHGQATVRGLSAGCTFKLKNHGRSDQNREYLVTSVMLHADAGEFAADKEQGQQTFSCDFTCIDKTQQFRPARTTPKPVVQGPQTAIVTGPAGSDDIYTDKYGRVKVHFHWDRYHKNEDDPDSSCWVRVSQNWAGKSWGSVHIPRVKQEVIVEFLEGDPDRPIITGRVYNADQTVPYTLPANKTQSGIKSRSTAGGADANFNEIQFEDKKGSEKLTIHAEKDQSVTVENDETVSIGHDRTETVGHDEKITVTNNRTEKVGVNETITIGADRTETVTGNETITVAKNRTRNVASNESVTVSLTRTHNVGINEAIQIGAAQQVNVGAAQTISVGANQDTQVGRNRSASVGKEDSLQVSKKLTIDVGEEILIKTGDASIHMKKDGSIDIKGKDVTITGSGNISVKADSNITMKGSKVETN